MVNQIIKDFITKTGKISISKGFLKLGLKNEELQEYNPAWGYLRKCEAGISATVWDSRRKTPCPLCCFL